MNDKLQVTYSIDISYTESYRKKYDGQAEIVVDMPTVDTVRNIDPYGLFKSMVETAIDNYINDVKKKEAGEEN